MKFMNYFAEYASPDATLTITGRAFGRRVRAWPLVLVFVLVAGCEGSTGPQGPAGPPGPPGPSGELAPELPALDRALAALGGQSELEALAAVRITSRGSRALTGASFSAGEPPFEAGAFTLTASFDLARDAMRLDYERELVFLPGAPMVYSEIIQGDVGVVAGSDSFSGMPGGDMTSVRWAAVTRQQRLLNPHVILKDILADPSIAEDAGLGIADGSVHELVRVSDPVHPITLWIHANTGRITRLTTRENAFLERDSDIEVHFADWQRAGDSKLDFPGAVLIARRGDVLHRETRDDIAVNPSFAADFFDFAAGSNPGFDAADAAFGAASSQAFNTYNGLGIPLDFKQVTVVADQRAPGVFHLTGGSHNSLAIEQQGGVVIVEAPLYPERGEAILAWAQSQFPGKRVTHVIATHHHEDHAAGLRAFVAAGATVVLHENSRAFFEDIFRASSAVAPDALHQNPAPSVIETVARGGTRTLADPERPITLAHVETEHADDMLVIHLSGQQTLFQSDLWTPGSNGGFAAAGARELYDLVIDRGLAVTEVLAGHGQAGTFEELEAFVNSLDGGRR